MIYSCLSYRNIAYKPKFFINFFRITLTKNKFLSYDLKSDYLLPKGGIRMTFHCSGLSRRKAGFSHHLKIDPALVVRFPMNFFKSFIFIICVLLIYTIDAYAWSSMESFDGFSTHQFLNAKAYEEIKKHPGLHYSGFPPLGVIQKYSGVTILNKGLGPDVDGNSYFSEHWYNPANEQGQAPKTIKRLHANLIKALNRPKKGIHYSEERALNNKARLAAYSAHYIQDMTCPMHVSGMERSKIQKNKVGSFKDISPYAVRYIDGRWVGYTQGDWKILVNRYEADRSKNVINGRHYRDFFDPLYYNGYLDKFAAYFIDKGASELGSHFQYEMQVEIKYARLFLDPSYSGHSEKWDIQEKRGYIPEGYKNDIDMKLLAIKAAKETYHRIGTAILPGELWVDQMNMYNSIKIPYYDWWRAIQLTYVTWRSSFCALHIKQNDIKFVKVPNQPKQYKLYVKVTNFEPTASIHGINVIYKIKGNFKDDGGTISFSDSIPANDISGWHGANKFFKINDPGKLSGKIAIEILGKYNQQIPDSGIKKIEYDLKFIKKEAIEVSTAIPDLQPQDEQGLEEEVPIFIARSRPPKPDTDAQLAKDKTNGPDSIKAVATDTEDLTINGVKLVLITNPDSLTIIRRVNGEDKIISGKAAVEQLIKEGYLQRVDKIGLVATERFERFMSGGYKAKRGLDPQDLKKITTITDKRNTRLKLRLNGKPCYPQNWINPTPEEWRHYMDCNKKVRELGLK